MTAAEELREPNSAWEALRRGWRKRCPHCGAGPIFARWNRPHPNCPACGYLFERDYGDVWWVLIVTDRIPVAIGIIFLYFGFRVSSLTVGVIFFGLLAIPLLLTMPRRQGLGIAAAYLSRRKWPDPEDVIPPLGTHGTR